MSRRGVILGAGIIAVAALAAYANSFHGPFVFDDPGAIANNASIRHVGTWLLPPADGTTVTGRPVLNLSLAVNYAFGGKSVTGYHALNLIIHILAGLTLFGIVRRTLGRLQRPPTEATLLGFAAALLWTVHPLQTESVTYIVQRAESLMGLFYLLTLYCFIRGADVAGVVVAGVADPGSRPQRGRLQSRHIWLGLSWLACLLGMATKEVMVSAPVIVFLYDRAFVTRSSSLRAALRLWRRYAAAASTWILLRILAAASLRAALRRRGYYYPALASTWGLLVYLVAASHGRNNTSGFGVGVSWWDYFLTQAPAIAHYLGLAVWPHTLVFDYGAQWVRNPLMVLPSATLDVALAAGTLWLLAKNRPLGFAGFLFFAILAPTSFMPGIRQTMAEHRMYLALAPVIVAGVVAVHGVLVRAFGKLERFKLRSSRPRRGRLLPGSATPATPETTPATREMALATTPRGYGFIESALDASNAAAPIFLVAALAAGAGLGWLTARRNTVYRSDLALWGDTVAKVPRNAFALTNLGYACFEAGRHADEIKEYRKALSLDPTLPETQNDLGIALATAKQFPEAITHLEEAVRLRPYYAEAQDNLGFALSESGQLSEAVVHYEEALKLKSEFPEADNGLGIAFMREQRLPEAIEHFREAVRIEPDNPTFRANLGGALGQAGQDAEAEKDLKEALHGKPDSIPKVRDNLARLLLRKGDISGGADQYRLALAADPGDAEAQNGLGIALVRARRLSEALTHFQEAVRLTPGNANFHANLGAALAASGRSVEAANEFEEALRINPGLVQVRAFLERLRPPDAPGSR